MDTLTRTLAFAAAVGVLATGAARAADVALFVNTTYVDYSPGLASAEASNLEATLVAQGHGVTTFTDTTAAGVANMLAGRDALVIPELEQGDLLPVVQASGADAEIADFVRHGGSLVVFGSNDATFFSRNLGLVNAASLFGYGLTSAAILSGVTSSLNAADAAGTAFRGGPSSLGGNASVGSVNSGSFPAGTGMVYADSGASTAITVAIIPEGNGYVIFIGWDWSDAVPTGVQDGDWPAVLNAAVNQAVDAAKADVALLANSTYVSYILGTNAPASNVQASAQRPGNKVMPMFGTVSAANLADVLAERDALLVPRLTSDLFGALGTPAKDEIVSFVETGGNLVVFHAGGGFELGLVNGLFGWSLFAGAAPGSPYTLNALYAEGTPFAGGPATVPHNAASAPVDLVGLLNPPSPAGVRFIYDQFAGPGFSIQVAVLPVGCGQVTLIGWDWDNAVPVGTLGPNYLDVLNRALSQRRRAYVANDFDGDGYADILWRNSGTGATFMWLMEGNVAVASGGLGAFANPPWQIAGTGDFDQDCKADILWRNTSTGANLLWLMDGLTKASTGPIGGVPPTWQIVGIRNYNEDRAADVLWRNPSTGGNIIWFMDGFGHTTASVGGVPSIWIVEE